MFMTWRPVVQKFIQYGQTLKNPMTAVVYKLFSTQIHKINMHPMDQSMTSCQVILLNLVDYKDALSLPSQAPSYCQIILST